MIDSSSGLSNYTPPVALLVGNGYVYDDTHTLPPTGELQAPYSGGPLGSGAVGANDPPDAAGDASSTTFPPNQLITTTPTIIPNPRVDLVNGYLMGDPVTFPNVNAVGGLTQAIGVLVLIRYHASRGNFACGLYLDDSPSLPHTLDGADINIIMPGDVYYRLTG